MNISEDIDIKLGKDINYKYRLGHNKLNARTWFINRL